MEIHLCLGAASIAARLAADRRPAPRRCADLEEAERLRASLEAGGSGSDAALAPREPPCTARRDALHEPRRQETPHGRTGMPAHA